MWCHWSDKRRYADDITCYRPTATTQYNQNCGADSKSLSLHSEPLFTSTLHSNNSTYRLSESPAAASVSVNAKLMEGQQVGNSYSAREVRLAPIPSVRARMKDSSPSPPTSVISSSSKTAKQLFLEKKSLQRALAEASNSRHLQLDHPLEVLKRVSIRAHFGTFIYQTFPRRGGAGN